jgi:hypothetical protein
MLTETVIIFSVLLGLLILISVMGGSVLPVENFADEVVMDEEDAPSPEDTPPAPAAEHMSAKEMEELAMSLAALPSDEERAKVMEPMSDDTKKVLEIMLKGMTVGSPQASTEGFSVIARKSTKEPVAKMQKKEPFTAMGKKEKKEPFTAMGKKEKKEPFAAMPMKEKKEHYSTRGSSDPVEPFDGDVYAMY